MKTIIFISFACMASALWAQPNASQKPLTADQVRQQAVNRMISDEVQRRQQFATPDQYQQIARQVSLQFADMHADASQLDPCHNLPAIAAKAIEQKLDSVIEQSYKYTFQYDTARQLMLSVNQFYLTDGVWTFNVSFNYSYDAQNRIIESEEIRQSNSYYNEVAYNSSGAMTHRKYIQYFYDNQQNILNANGNDYTYNDQGILLRNATLRYDPAVGVYEAFATEYEYFDLPVSGYYSLQDYVRKTTEYMCQTGSFELQPTSRVEWQQDFIGCQREEYVNGTWFTTYLSTMDAVGLTRTEKYYTIMNGTSYLSSQISETRYGWSGNFASMNNTRRRTTLYYDANGNITRGNKEDHLHDWGVVFESDYYRWDTNINDWAFDYSVNHYGGSSYEGELRQIVEYPILSCETQIYHNGQWVTSGFYGPLEVEPIVPYGDPGFIAGNCRHLHYLFYSVDIETGNYLEYSEDFNTYENGVRIYSDTYDMPNRAHQASRTEYDYTPDGNPAETRYFINRTDSLELSERIVYEYDQNICTDQILHQGNTKIESGYLSFYVLYDLNTYHHKPLSVKRYDAAGNCIEEYTQFFYSSINGDSDNSLHSIMHDGSFKSDSYLNLMGQPVTSPQPGQPLIDAKRHQVVIW